MLCSSAAKVTIGVMNIDENDVDRRYFPERHIPVPGALSGASLGAFVYLFATLLGKTIQSQRTSYFWKGLKPPISKASNTIKTKVTYFWGV